MGLRCPACGFESPDGAQWCDFCKEPFRAQEAAPPAGTRPPPDKEAGTALPLDPREIEKALAQDWARKTPSAPKGLRLAAIVFLLAWILAGTTAALVLLLRRQRPPQPGEEIQLGKPQIINIQRTE